MQAATQNNQATKQDTQPVPAMRLIKIGECPSLSGSSTLTYHVGVDDAGAFHIRLFGNSLQGVFSKEWVALESGILKAFGGRETVKSGSLRPLYRDSNSPGFLAAVCVAESILLGSSKQQGSYLPVDPAAYKAELKVLIDSAINLKVEEKSRKAEPIKLATPIKKATPASKGI